MHVFKVTLREWNYGADGNHTHTDKVIVVSADDFHVRDGCVTFTKALPKEEGMKYSDDVSMAYYSGVVSIELQ